MRDEEFIRDQVPMTKYEVRAVSLAKLELTEAGVLYDIGAGTGSVSIEGARIARLGKVLAVEKDPSALVLLQANKKKFQADNMEIIPGTAPEILAGLEKPTHVFIGGSSGNMEGILDAILKKNPKARVVINLIALESLTGTMAALKKRGIEPEIVSIQAARARKAGEYHLMQGQNPVYILSFGGREIQNDD